MGNIPNKTAEIYDEIITEKTDSTNAETVGQYARQKVAAVLDTARSIAKHKNLPNTALLGEMDDDILGTKQNTSDSQITAFLEGNFETDG